MEGNEVGRETIENALLDFTMMAVEKEWESMEVGGFSSGEESLAHKELDKLVKGILIE